MTIETWAPTLKAKLAEIAELGEIHNYDELPGALASFPCTMIVPSSGSQTLGDADVALHRIRIAVYIAGQVLPQAYSTAVPLIAKVRDKLAANMKLGGAVQYIIPDEPFYEGPGAVTYGDATHIGIVFHYVVKEIEALTLSA